ncbi:hypothetical protein ABTC04_18320, partial [Acinetobacter baumannii]
HEAEVGQAAGDGVGILHGFDALDDGGGATGQIGESHSSPDTMDENDLQVSAVGLPVSNAISPPFLWSFSSGGRVEAARTPR